MAEIIHELISEEELDRKVRELAAQISRDYEGRSLHLICILKGSCIFMSDLAKRITCPVTLDFMTVSSYGSGTSSSGEVKISHDLSEPLEGRDVLIVEDIIDSGRTLFFLKKTLEDRGARSIAIVTLLDKPERRVVDLSSDYYAFRIPDAFVVGYGLDYDQKYRNLPYVGTVEFTEEEVQ